MKIPIAKEGVTVIKFFLIFAIGFYILGILHWFFYIFALCSLIIVLFLFYFFRDPERKIEIDENKILSPADGKVIEISEKEGTKIIKIFMSPFNVHIQRSPITGKVKSIEYKPGKFLRAYVKESSEVNEQNIIEIEDIQIKQIAGIIARRIVCWVQEGANIQQGQRIGMIKLGSQVDISLPILYNLKIKEGDKVKAGISVVAERRSITE